MRAWAVCAAGVLLSFLAIGLVSLPAYIHYRNLYEHHKRLRVVAPDTLYRCGQLTADGFRDAVHSLGIRTVVNVQDEYPDPKIATDVWLRGTTSEVELCSQLGVRYVHLQPDLRPERNDPRAEPLVIDSWRKLLDDPANYPILLHCKAGLHRTGVLAAVYRMEFEGWSNHLAARELKAHGFGDTYCTAANDYVRQYVLNYRPRRTRLAAAE